MLHGRNAGNSIHIVKFRLCKSAEKNCSEAGSYYSCLAFLKIHIRVRPKRPPRGRNKIADKMRVVKSAPMYGDIQNALRCAENRTARPRGARFPAGRQNMYIDSAGRIC